MAEFDLTGKKALVTGSTQGIGKAVAVRLAAHGAQVVFHGSRDSGKCGDVLGRLKGASFAAADLSRDDGARTLYGQTGDVDILVVNASVQFRRPWDEIGPEEFDRQVRVNFKSSLGLIQLYAPHMLSAGWGRILTVGSVQQRRPHPQMLVYAATKSAQRNMARNLAKQFAPRGVTVNNLSPGAIATPRNDAALSDAAYRSQVVAGIPAGRVGEPEECAGAALLLCSEEGRYITGVDLPVDGGMGL